jgi:anti-sigma B factor antagonist
MLADVEFSGRGQVLVASLSGEIDLSNAASIGRALTDATPNQVLALIVDLSGVDYLDSAGIQLIYQLRESLRARGQALRLVIPPRSPANDALRLAGVERHIPMTRSLDDALHEPD